MSDLKMEHTPPKRKFLANGKIKDVLIIGVLAIVLIIAVWKIFSKEDTSVETTSMRTENEQKVSNLLSEIEGVGDAEVMIYETEEGVQSVVVVCEGADDLQVIMDVREAVATALGTQEKAVKIYLKK